MLVLTRKPGQVLRIQPRDGEICSLSVGELFAGGPLEILIGKVYGRQVRLGIQAHRELLVMRMELERSQ
jgi:sRNA-binding carbon storage regulator CsrA